MLNIYLAHTCAVGDLSYMRKYQICNGCDLCLLVKLYIKSLEKGVDMSQSLGLFKRFIILLYTQANDKSLTWNRIYLPFFKQTNKNSELLIKESSHQSNRSTDSFFLFYYQLTRSSVVDKQYQAVLYIACFNYPDMNTLITELQPLHKGRSKRTSY